MIAFLTSKVDGGNQDYVTTAIYGLALALLAVAVAAWLGLLPIDLDLDAPVYLALHAADELLAVLVALLIFATGYHAWNRQHQAGTIFVACAFLAVGLLDLLHTFSYPGMGDFFTPNTNQKSVVLWLAARLPAALGLLVFVLLLVRPPQTEWPRWPILVCFLLYTAMAGSIGVLSPELLPAMVRPEGVGMSAFKNGAEWLFILLHLATLAILFYHRRLFSRPLLNYLPPALIILMASGLFFTLYQHSTDGLIFLGHLYKVAGYLLLYRAIFIENIHQPYHLLADAQQKLQLLNYAMDQVNEAVYLVNREARFEYVNEGACRITGYPRRELLGKKTGDLDPDFPMTRWHQHWQELSRKGHLLFESRHRDRQGRIFPVEINANYFVYQDKDYNLALVRDISERKEAEAQLAASHTQLLEAQRIAHLGSWVWDIAPNTLTWSDEIYRIFGVEPRAFGASYDAFLAYVHPKDREAVQQAVNEALEGKRPYNIEHRLRREDGQERWVMEQSEVERDAKSGRPLRMIGTVMDITERKLVEARELQADKMSALGLMAGGIAHDFNNILTPIIMHSQLALRASPPESKQQHNLEQVLKAAERAAGLVRQILDFSHQGQHEPQLIKLSLIIKEAVKFLQSVTPANIIMSHQINTDRDSLAADPTQMLQVIMNLCLNAIHAMGDDDGVLTISLDEVSAPAELPGSSPSRNAVWLKLTVRDTGCGIAPENLAKLFTPFFTTKEKGEGTGMGLPVVHGIVTRHGGRIEVRSQLNRGSCFEVLLPALGEGSEEQAPAPAPPTGNGECILLVDDEPAVLEAAAAALASLNYQVVTAPDAAKALELLRRNKGRDFDLLITDYNMPKLKGTELAAAAKVIREELPIILCTGYSSSIDETAAVAMGISALIMKPLRQEILAGEIRRILKQRRLHRGNGFKVNLGPTLKSQG